MITLHNLHSSQTRHQPKRVGRGNSSGKGTTAGRGTKGQRARTGGRNKLIRRGLKHLIERTPKTSGFTSRRTPLAIVDLDQLQRYFEPGRVVTPSAMITAGLIKRDWPGVKILGSGKLTKRLTVHAHRFTTHAKTAIVQAGGTAVTITIASRKTVKPQPAVAPKH